MECSAVSTSTAIPLIGPIPGPLAEAFQEFGHIRYWRFNGDYMIKPTLLNHLTVGINQRKLGEGPTLGCADSLSRRRPCYPA